MKKVLLYSLEYGGECRLYQSEKLLPWKIKKILDVAKHSFQMLAESGERLDECQFAELEQSEQCTHSVKVDLNNGQVTCFEINSGLGGISEANRTNENTRLYVL